MAYPLTMTWFELLVAVVGGLLLTYTVLLLLLWRRARKHPGTVCLGDALRLLLAYLDTATAMNPAQTALIETSPRIPGRRVRRPRIPAPDSSLSGTSGGAFRAEGNGTASSGGARPRPGMNHLGPNATARARRRQIPRSM
jgi:hypothetical protein